MRLETIALVSLFVLLGGALVAIKIAVMLSNHSDDTSRQDKMVLSVLQETAKSQRMMTCIMAIPQDKREQEYRDPNSFCHQVSAQR